ncbi:MAG: hypothetical protein KBG83_00075 [Bacteroidetes bacterium]|jgi:hypothetical protein|nr:hypothetical protein [Bacteroidota bacterium]
MEKNSKTKYRISIYSGELLSGNVKNLFTSLSEALEWSDRLIRDPKKLKSVRCVISKGKRYYLAAGNFPAKDSKPVKRTWYGKNGIKLNVEEL